MNKRKIILTAAIGLVCAFALTGCSLLGIASTGAAAGAGSESVLPAAGGETDGDGTGGAAPAAGGMLEGTYVTYAMSSGGDEDGEEALVTVEDRPEILDKYGYRLTFTKDGVFTMEYIGTYLASGASGVSLPPPPELSYTVEADRVIVDEGSDTVEFIIDGDKLILADDGFTFIYRKE